MYPSTGITSQINPQVSMARSTPQPNQSHINLVLNQFDIPKVNIPINNRHKSECGDHAMKELRHRQRNIEGPFQNFYQTLRQNEKIHPLYQVYTHDTKRVVLAITSSREIKPCALQSFIHGFQSSDDNRFGTFLENVSIRTSHNNAMNRPLFILNQELTTDIVKRLGTEQINGLPDLIVHDEHARQPRSRLALLPNPLGPHEMSITRFIQKVSSKSIPKDQTSPITKLFFKEAKPILLEAAQKQGNTGQSIFSIFESSDLMCDFYKVQHSKDTIIITLRLGRSANHGHITRFRELLEPFKDLGEFIEDKQVRTFSHSNITGMKIMFLLYSSKSQQFKDALKDRFESVPKLFFYQVGRKKPSPRARLAIFEKHPHSPAMPPIIKERKRKAEDDGQASTQRHMVSATYVASSHPEGQPKYPVFSEAAEITFDDLFSYTRPNTFIQGSGA